MQPCLSTSKGLVRAADNVWKRFRQPFPCHLSLRGLATLRAPAVGPPPASAEGCGWAWGARRRSSGWGADDQTWNPPAGSRETRISFPVSADIHSVHSERDISDQKTLPSVGCALDTTQTLPSGNEVNDYYTKIELWDWGIHKNI